MNLLLTSPASFGILRMEPRNSSTKVRQHLKRGHFFVVRTLEKYGVFSVISGREWVNRIPCKGEHARRSQTVFDSRPFLRPAKGHHEKICEVFHVPFSSLFPLDPVPVSACLVPSVLPLPCRRNRRFRGCAGLARPLLRGGAVA